MNRKIRSIVIFCMLCVAICGCRKDDAAIAVQGLKIDSQRTLSLSDKPVRLSVQTVPEKVTEHYTLVWESSDPEVVRIEPDGTAIPGKKGSASVCCYLAERPSVRALCAFQVVSDAVVFEDERFEKALLSLCDRDGDGEISPEEAASVKRINVRNLRIRSLKGIEYFENLEELDCSMNLLTAEGLDLSRNTALRVLDCSGNNALGRLDVTHNPELERLHCKGARLSGLDVTHNPKILCTIIRNTS